MTGDGHVLCWYRLCHVEPSTGSIESGGGGVLTVTESQAELVCM